MDVIDSAMARITICKHIFCSACIERVINQQQKCPICRTVLPTPEKSLVAATQESTQDDSESLNNMGESSSKLDALLHILEGMRAQDSF